MPTLYICYVALYRCRHYDILLRSAPWLQIEKARLEIVRLFYVWNKVKMQVRGKRQKNKRLEPTLYICYVTFYCCGHHQIFSQITTLYQIPTSNTVGEAFTVVSYLPYVFNLVPKLSSCCNFIVGLITVLCKTIQDNLVNQVT